MPTVTLPKVAQYIRNVGKSVKLASIDYLSDAAPATSDFIETNQELFKEIYSATINYKTTVRKANKALKASKIYEAYDQGKKALFEDLKTGNFYNKGREEALGMRGLDMDMDDMDFDPSMMDFSDNDSSDAAKQSRAFDRSIEASTKAQAVITAQSADLVATTIKAGNTAAFVQNEKILSSLNTGMAGIHAAIGGLGKYMEGPMMAHLQNTKVFQENSLKYQEQITKQLDEMLEMQRNLYGLNQQQAAPNSNNPLEDIISYEGTPDIKAYAKQIGKNLKGVLGPEFDMIFGDSFGKNSNPLLAFVGSPLKVLPELLVKSIVPVTVKKVAEEFDKSVSGIFTSLIARFNSMADEDSGNGRIMQMIGRLFGIKVERKTGVDTGKFKKGPVPFDGITRQAIIEVIPAHLRRIESALTGQAERLYDARNGKWTNIKAIEKEYKDRQHASVIMSFSEVVDTLNSEIKKLRESRNEESVEIAKQLEETFETVAYKVFERGGDFKGYRFTKDPDTGESVAPWDFYDVDKDTYMRMMKYLSDVDNVKAITKDGRRNNRANMAHLANETMRQIDAWNKYLSSAENDNSPILQLFNGAYKVDTALGTKYNPKAPIAPMTGYSNFLTSAVDDKNKNIFFYLQGIYGLMLARDKNGTTPSGTRRGRKKRNTSPTIPVTPEEALNAVIAASLGPVEQEYEEIFDENGLSPEEIDQNYELEKLMRAQQDKVKRDPEGSFIGEFKKAVNWGERFKVVKQSIDTLLEKPSSIITSWIDTADAKVYAMLFGKEDMEEAEKRFGKKPGGIVDRLVFRIEDTFDKLDDWFKEHVFDKVKKWMEETGITEKFNKAKDWVKDKIHWNEVKDAFKSKFGFAKSQVTGAFRGVKNDINNSYYFRRRRGINEMAADMEGIGDLYRAANQTIDEQNFDDFLEQYQFNEPEWDDGEYGGISTAASGKFITKRGLAIVSPGETIIPATFSKKGQKRQLAKEKAYAKRFGIKNVNYYAEGTDSDNGMAQTTSTKDSEAVKKTIKQVAKEISPGSSIVDIAVNSLIGGGVSLITGLVGGPLLGAAVGAGVGVVKQSQTARDFLFGTETTDKQGNVITKKGLISKDFQKKFEKYFPDMKNYGIVGGIAGLFTPFGLVGGLMAGGAIGFLKQNDKFQEYLFGPKNEETGERDGGLISKAFKEKVSKAVPRMAIGAIGGALIGGPFGLLGNAALGSALGFVTTTDGFHKFIFGEEDADGNKKGGVVQAINEGMVKPLINWGKEMISEGKKFLQEKILKPLQDFISPFGQMIKNAINNVADKVKEGFEGKVITPISDFLHHKILEPIGRTLGKIIKAPIALAKGVISAPFQLLGGIGNNIRATQIGKGTATDMTAAERMEWRNKHQNRRTINNILGRDKFGGIDRMLTRNFEGEEGLNKMKEARDNLALYLDSRREFNNRVARLQQDLINEVSNILNERTMQDPATGDTVSVYTYVRYKSVQRINKLISQGKLDEAIEELNSGRFINVPTDVRNEVSQTIQRIGAPIYDAINRQKNANDFNQRFEAQMSRITGGKLKGRKDMRAFKNILDKEISTRESRHAEDDEAARKSIAEQQTDKMGEFLDKQTTEIVTVLKQIRTALYGERKDPFAEQEKEEAERVAQEAAEAAYAPGFDEFTADAASVGTEEGELPELGRWGKFKNRVKASFNMADEVNKYAKRSIGRGRRTLFTGLGNAWRSAKEQAKAGWEAGSEEFVESRNAWREMNKDRAKNGEDAIKWRDAKKFNRENDGYVSGQAAMTAQGAKDAVQSIGGMLVGSKHKLAAMANKAYHMVNIGGKFGIADGDGTLLKTQASKDIEKAQEEENEYKKKTSEALTTMSKGIIGTVTGILGAGWQKVKDVKNSLFDKVNDILDATGPVGTVIKAIFGIGKIAVAASLFGHFASFWTNSIWNPIIKPFWNETLEPALQKIGSKVYTFIQEHFPTLTGIVDGIKSGFERFIENPLGTIGNFFVDGLKKFWDYVAEPLGTLLWNAIHSVSLDDFNTKQRSTETKTYSVQEYDSDGNPLYIDTDGNTTTNAWSSNGEQNTIKTTTESINVTTSVKKGGLINWISHGGKTLEETRTATHNGIKYTLEKYSNDLIIITNSENEDMVKFTLGGNEIKIAYKSDKDGNPKEKGSIGDIASNLFLGAGFGVAVAGAAALGGAVGSFMPGIGTIIGAAVGVAFGLTVYTIKNSTYQKTELTLNPTDNPAEYTTILAAMGWIGDLDNIDNWPQFADNVSASYSTKNSGNSRTSVGGGRSSGSSSGTSRRGDGRYTEYTANIGKEAQSGTGHIYQKAAGIANQKFGNTTIGEAGCGPVAATNLINKLGGNMDVNTAASYAENGGFIDRRTGGATTDYISSILNSSGISAAETTDKDYVYNSLKHGNPVVMLGNSGRSRQTPFGANDHYITALGMDKQGNIITEDPDTPNGYAKFKANQVMHDMQVGIATGNSRFFGKGRRPGKARKIRSGRVGSETTTDTTKSQHADWTFRCAEALARVESNCNYAAVNKNDNGGLSIGRYQYHNSRAKSMLNSIIDQLIYDNIYSSIEAIEKILGSDLAYWLRYSDKNSYILSSSEANAIAQLIDTETGHEIQDRIMISDIEGYYTNYLKPLGLDVSKQENVVIYLASSVHNTGNASAAKRVINAAKKLTGKSTSALELDEVHKIMLSDSYGKNYTERYNDHYTFLTGTEPAGTSLGTYSYDENSYSSTMQQLSEDYNTDSKSGILAELGNVIKAAMTKIYGEGLMSIFGGSNTSNSSTGSNYPIVYSTTGKSTSGQQALVDWMKSIKGKISYSLNGPQDPDQGSASCASTVGWAYRKALGINGMSANSIGQMYDNINNKNFSYIYASDIMKGATTSGYNSSTDLEKFQPGDIIYYRTNRGVSLGRDYGVGHVEMYAGDNKRIGHGGPNEGDLGPNIKSFDSNSSNIVAGIRYTPFLAGMQPDYYNTDGTKGTYPELMTSYEKLNSLMSANNPYANSALKTAANKELDEYLTDQGYSKIETDDGIPDFMKASGTSRDAKYEGLSLNARKKLNHKINTNLSTLGLKSLKPATYSGTSRSGMATTSGVSYEDFLTIIIELLTIIAKNSDKMSEIITILSKSNVNVSKEDIATVGTSKSAQSRLKDAIRKSGLGRSTSANSSKGTPYGGAADERNPNDIQYVIGLMESLARS